jgi:hypothetical protein
MFVDYNPKSNPKGENIDLDEPSQLFVNGKDRNHAVLDDETIVKRFAIGKRRVVSNQNLRIDYAHNSLQLSTPDGELIAIHKASDRFQYILVKKDAEYSEFIHNLILEHQFIPIDPSSANRGFIRYQKYQIPEHYKLQYSPASQLWNAWKDHKQDLDLGWRLDVLILCKSKWYRVQDMSLDRDLVALVTRVGTITNPLSEKIAWIEKLETVPPETLARTRAAVKQQLAMPNSDSDILAKIMSRLAIESEPHDLDYNEGNDASIVPRPLPELSSSSLSPADMNQTSPSVPELIPQKERLLAMAMEVLEHYLDAGETIVRTEITCDAEGNRISEKTVSTTRGCPRWAIDAVLSLE